MAPSSFRSTPRTPWLETSGSTRWYLGSVPIGGLGVFCRTVLSGLLSENSPSEPSESRSL
jgi:hypothetical protein